MNPELTELKLKLTEMKKVLVKKKNTKEYALAYYHKNNIPCQCECGKMTKTISIYKHRLSKKHIKIMEIKEIEKRINTLENPQ